MTETMTKTDRLGYIGGSDAAAVVGLSRWRTPLQVWSEKTGAIAPDDISGKLHIRLGHMMEPVVADLFEEESGFRLKEVRETQIDGEFDFLRAQIDRRVISSGDNVEIKTAHPFKAKEWADADAPPEYIIQCLHGLMVTKRERCHLVCVIGNQEFVWKIIERDDDMISELRRKEVEFWTKFVIPRVMPAVSFGDMETLLGLFPIGRGADQPTPLPGELEAVAARYKEIGSEKAGLLGELVKEKELLGNQLRMALKDASVGTAGRFKVSWTSQSTGVRLDTERIRLEAPEVYSKFGKAGNTRVLRIAEAKDKKGGK